MNVFDQLAPFVPQISARPEEDRPRGTLSSPTSLTSPIVKKKTIHIPSFDEQGALYGPRHKTKSIPDSSSVPAPLFLDKPVARMKSAETWQRNQLQRSTLPRIKPKSERSPFLFSSFVSPSEPNSMKPTTTYVLPPPSIQRRPSTFLHKLCSSPTVTTKLSPTTYGMQEKSLYGPVETPRSICKVEHKQIPPKKDRCKVQTQEQNRRVDAGINEKVVEGQPRNTNAISYLTSRSLQRQFDGINVQPEVTPGSKLYTQHSDSTCFSQGDRRLPMTPPMTRSVCSPNVEAMRQQFDISRSKDDLLYQPEDTATMNKWSSHHVQQDRIIQDNIQKPTLWSAARRQNTLVDGHKCVSQDSTDHSRVIDRCPCKTSRSRTFREDHLNWKTSPLDSFQHLTALKADIIHHLDDGSADPILTDLSAPPDRHRVSTELLEPSSEKCSRSCSVTRNTNSIGTVSKGSFNPQARLQRNQKPEATAAPVSEKQPTEPEDPYYVTMYYPGSVYVDMSDVVPPEVRPKPVVPAKPPNVGAPSPSSHFPLQGLGMGGGGVAVPPPSAIPVPIGSHGPSHVSTHGVGHGVGHSGGHGGSNTTMGGSTLLGYIGIDTIIEQMRKKTMKTGFDFNIMVVGHSGLGKSTLVNTLFKSQVSRKSAGWSRDDKIPKTVEIKSVSHVIEEGGVKMKLTVVDTPGFGDQINNDNCWEPISKYINEQFEKFLKEEVNITRKKRIPDTRVHCCLYFIPATGHSLRQIDVEFMKRLSHSVNIIPVIAKSDTMTAEERQEFKQRVRKELEMGGIEFYPQKEFDEDMEDKSDNDKIREAMPFAIVGSDKEYQVNGKRVLGRKTAWGVVEVENPNHCEFALLRDFLIRSHLQDLKEVTHNIHYETYRAKRLNDNGGLHPISSGDTQESNL